MISIKHLKGRKWIFAATTAAGLLLLLLFVPQSPGNPGVSMSFLYRTNLAAGEWIYFSATNPSPLAVHLIGEQIASGPVLQRHAETIPPGGASVFPISPSNHRYVHAMKSTNSAAAGDHRSPSEVILHFRRQDTRFEEAREQLDSVLRSVGITLPGLNPDSSRNLFEVIAPLPSEQH